MRMTSTAISYGGIHDSFLISDTKQDPLLIFAFSGKVCILGLTPSSHFGPGLQLLLLPHHALSPPVY